MALTAHSLLLILGLISFVVAASGWTWHPRFSFLALGLAFFDAAFLVG